MTDTIESLRARVTELESSPTMAAVRKTVESKVAEENTRLYQRIAELEAEVERLSERRCEVCGYAEHHREHSGCLRQQLAAQALTIKTMREALEKFIDSHEECTDFDGLTAQIVSMDDYHEAQEALALPNDATALNELITERTKTQKEYYESVFQDGANRNAELTAENRELRMSRSLRQEQHDGEIAELTAQRDVAIGILEHIRRCIPYGGFAQIHDGSATVADIDAAIANCKEPGK